MENSTTDGKTSSRATTIGTLGAASSSLSASHTLTTPATTATAARSGYPASACTSIIDGSIADNNGPHCAAAICCLEGASCCLRASSQSFFSLPSIEPSPMCSSCSTPSASMVNV